MISSEGIDCNPGVTRGLKSPPRPGQKSVLLAERFTVVPDSCVALPLSATPTSLPVTPEATGSSPVHPASFRQGSRQLAGLPSCVSRMSPSQSPTSRRLPERTSRNCARQIPCTPPSRLPACRLTRFAPDASRVHGICSQHSCCLSQPVGSVRNAYSRLAEPPSRVRNIVPYRGTAQQSYAQFGKSASTL